MGLLLTACFVVTGDANLNALDHEGRTPLHSAAIMGSSKAVKTLIELGASPTVRDKTNATAAEAADQMARQAMSGQHAQIAGLLRQVAEDMLLCQARQRLAFARGALTTQQRRSPQQAAGISGDGSSRMDLSPPHNIGMAYDILEEVCVRVRLPSAVLVSSTRQAIRQLAGG